MVRAGARLLTGDRPDWAELSDWWLDELAGDPSYDDVVLPLALELLDPIDGAAYLDVGCGEGRFMAAIRRRGGTAIGVDLSDPLLERAAEHGRVHRAEVPPLDFLADESVDGVAIVLVLEHLGDERGILSEAARVTRPGGSLVVVANHPIWTAPGSTPIVDGDGEVVWRTGEYFSRGWSDEPAGEGSVRFHHRTMADLLNAAADAGWALRRLEEMGVTAEQIQRTPGLAGQEHIPRLLGAAWSRGRP